MQECMTCLKEHLVRVQVRRALVQKWVRRVRKTSAAFAQICPQFVISSGLAELLVEWEFVVRFVVFVEPYLVAERMRNILHPVGTGLETGAVVPPIELDTLLMAEVLLLPVERLLLAVTAIERIDIGEELLGVRLLHFPGRVADDGVKAWGLTLEDIREFQFPVEEAMGNAQLADDLLRSGGGLQEVHRQWRVLQQITRPEPDGAPCVESRTKLAIGGAASKMLLIDPPALLGLVNRQVMNLLENANEVIVYADGRKLRLEEFEGFRAPGADELHQLGPNLLFPILDGVGPFVAFLGIPLFPVVINELLSILVAAIAVPSHGGVVLKPVEPATDERVAGLHLVIEEAEGQARIHGLNPEGKTGEFDGKLIQVDAIKAALYNVAAEVGAQVVVEVWIADGLGDCFIGQLGRGLCIREPNNNAGWIRHEPLVVVQAFHRCVGQESQRRQKKGAGATGRVTNLDGQDLFRLTRRIAFVGQFSKSAAGDWARKLGTSVESTGALSGVTFADQIPLTREDGAGHKAPGGLVDILVIGALFLRRRLAFRLLDQFGGLPGPARPRGEGLPVLPPGLRGVAGIRDEVFLDHDLREYIAGFRPLFWRFLFVFFSCVVGVIIAGRSLLVRHFEFLEQLGDLIRGHGIQLQEGARRLVAQVEEDDGRISFRSA